MARIKLEESISWLETINGTRIQRIGNEERRIYGGISKVGDGDFDVPETDYHTLSMLPGGQFDIWIEGGMLTPGFTRARPQDILFIPAFRPVRFKALPDQTYTHYMPPDNPGAFFLLFPPALMAPKLQAITQKEVDPDVPLNGLVVRPSALFRNLGRALVAEFVAEMSGRAGMMDALSDALLLEFARMYEDARTAVSDTGGFDARQQARVSELMEVAVDGSISIGDIAQLMELSPPTLTRNFRATFGVTPTEFLLDIRLNRAREALLNSDASISEIAYDCGFSSQAHFTTRFSQAFGMPPGQFRTKG